MHGRTGAEEETPLSTCKDPSPPSFFLSSVTAASVFFFFFPFASSAHTIKNDNQSEPISQNPSWRQNRQPNERKIERQIKKKKPSSPFSSLIEQKPIKTHLTKLFWEAKTPIKGKKRGEKKTIFTIFFFIEANRSHGNRRGVLLLHSALPEKRIESLSKKNEEWIEYHIN